MSTKQKKKKKQEDKYSQEHVWTMDKITLFKEKKDDSKKQVD